MGLSQSARGLWVCVLLTGLAFAAACSDSGGSPGSRGGDGGGEAGNDAGAAAAGETATDHGGAPSALGGGAAVDAGAGGEAPLGFIERLANLGAKTDLERAPVDADDKPLPSSYHPLKKPFATLEPHQEIYYSGPLLGGQREGMLNDGFTGGFGPLLNAQFTSWLTADYRTAVAGDFDGDGIQEFVGVYYDASSKKLMAKMIWGPRGNVAARSCIEATP